MPKIIGYTPSWLSKPSSGAEIFSDPEPQSPVSPSKKSSYFGSTTTSSSSASAVRRLIAQRGTEIFTVVGNKIRWADLNRVKDEWEDRNHNAKTTNGRKSYRTLVTPVYYRITQLIISPSGNFLAICTEHTIHVAVLPDSSRLVEHDHSPIKLKTFHLGPTTHVIPESPLASVLWHPLAASTSSTDCLVTITTEAAVRVWEIQRSNPWSFEHPALAIDLRKLADGVSSDQDFAPSAFGKNRGFSVDTFEMEVTAASFGGSGAPDEDPWASMTLWTAMSNGDVYALCPLLPSKWMPTITTIPALAISAVSQIATQSSSDADADARQAAEQQYAWVQQIDNEEPQATNNANYRDLEEARNRPSNPSAVPRLQGPFEIDAINDVDDGEITDLRVVAARLDEEALLSGEEDYEAGAEGVQFTLLCLTTTNAKLHIAVELEGVSGQWLLKKGRSTFSVPLSEGRDLVLLDTVNCSHGAAESRLWPLMTPDLVDPYSFYVTTTNHIKSISLSDWATRVGIEFSGEVEADTGLQTRLGLACETNISVVTDVLSIETGHQASSTLSTPVILHDINVGNIMITQGNGQAQAVLFDVDSFGFPQEPTSSIANPALPWLQSQTVTSQSLDNELPEPMPIRAPYGPADVFYRNQMQPYEELRGRIPASRKAILSDSPIRLSPACLDIMTLAHRTFSAQTSNIEKAAAELFRRCERLQEELRDQVKQMSELADRLQNVSSVGESDDPAKKTFEERVSQAQEKQKMLQQRYEKLRRKTGRIGTANQDLSTKEEAWIQEIETLEKTIQCQSQDTNANNLYQRFRTVQDLAKELLEQCKPFNKDTSLRDSTSSLNRNFDLSDPTASKRTSYSISTRMQKERIGEVMAMVDRESAIIDAVLTRLNKLNVTK